MTGTIYTKYTHRILGYDGNSIGAKTPPRSMPNGFWIQNTLVCSNVDLGIATFFTDPPLDMKWVSDYKFKLAPELMSTYSPPT